MWIYPSFQVEPIRSFVFFALTKPHGKVTEDLPRPLEVASRREWNAGRWIQVRPKERGFPLYPS